MKFKNTTDKIEANLWLKNKFHVLKKFKNTIEPAFWEMRCSEVLVNTFFFPLSLWISNTLTMLKNYLQWTTENIIIGDCEVFLFKYKTKPSLFYCLGWTKNLCWKNKGLRNIAKDLYLFLECCVGHFYVNFTLRCCVL